MKALILDNSIDHEVYEPITHWKRFLKIPFDSFRASKNEFPEATEGYSHVIITGSEASILNDYEWVRREEQLIRDAVSENKSVFGSCYGHQLLARALFGARSVARSQTPEIGWGDLNVAQDDQWLGKSGDKLPVLFIHFDEVVRLPFPEVDVLATTLRCRIQIFKLKGKDVWGMQSHPEMMIDDGLHSIASMRDRAKREGSPNLTLFEDALKTKPADAKWFEGFMERFQSPR